MIFRLFPAAMTQSVSSQGRSDLTLAEKSPEARIYESKREPRNNNKWILCFYSFSEKILAED